MLQKIINNYIQYYDESFPELRQNIQSDIYVKANRSLIEILLSNLIKNAIEHNQQNGSIIIELIGRILYIKNTGVPPETKTEALFERFRKGSHKSKTTGLGLALVKQICLLYHYSIQYNYKNGWHEMIVNFDKS